MHSRNRVLHGHGARRGLELLTYFGLEVGCGNELDVGGEDDRIVSCRDLGASHWKSSVQDRPGAHDAMSTSPSAIRASANGTESLVVRREALAWRKYFARRLVTQVRQL